MRIRPVFVVEIRRDCESICRCSVIIVGVAVSAEVVSAGVVSEEI